MSRQHLRRAAAARLRRSEDRRLLALWRSHDDAFKDYAEELLGDDRLDGCLTALANHAGPSYLALLADLRAIASGHVMPVPDRDACVYVRLFVIPIQGRRQEILSLQRDDDAFEALAAGFRAAGLAAEPASVLLAPDLVKPVAAALTMPGRLRRLAVAAAEAELEARRGGTAEGFARLVRGLQTDEVLSSVKEAGSAALVARLIIGARVGIGTSDLDIAGGIAPFTDEFQPEGFDALVDDWLKQAEAAVKSRHPEISLGKPVTWDAALFQSARNRAEGMLRFEASLLNLDWREIGDGRAHVCLTEDRLLVAVEFRGHVLGPIDLPVLLLSGMVDEVQLWLEGMCATLAIHDDPVNMPSHAAGAAH